MICIELQGGLGNQMFQYACAKTFSLQKKTICKVDNSILNNGISNEHFSARLYELNIFKANVSVLNSNERIKYSPKSIFQKVWYKWIFKYRHYCEQTFFYDIFLNRQRGNLYLHGYWQSEKYFIAYEEVIRNDFIFTAPKNNETILHEKKILQNNSISIHIRRGDYITSPSANIFHGVTDLKYYELAMQEIENYIANPIYFVFSDDQKWVKENIVKSRKNMVLIDHNTGEDNWQDMYLMTVCKHNIIANSSFSWWGAWLNNNPDKIVIAPKKWYANIEQNNKTKDLLPDTWIKL